MNWNIVIEICEALCEAIAATLIGVGLGVAFAMVIIIAETGAIGF